MYMLVNLFRYVTLVFLLVFHVVHAEESIKTQEFDELKLTEFTLNNGMRVVLKQTDDGDEITARLVALGGFASLSSSDRASGELAGAIVMESGIGNLSADKLSALLYHDSIEFNLKIEPFARGVDATFPADSLKSFLSLVNEIFVAPQFNQEAFVAILSKKRSQLKSKEASVSKNVELSFLSKKEKEALRPLTAKDLNHLNLNKSKQFFEAAFSNPGDFILVVAGDFDKEQMKKLTAQYLGTIPVKTVNQKFALPSYGEPSRKGTIKVQNLSGCNESVVRIAFPLNLKLDQLKLEQLEVTCQIMENRFRNIVKSNICEAKSVDVWYDLPLYPSLEHPWMAVQFYMDNANVKPMIKLIFEELKRIQEKGVTQEEVNLAIQMKKQSFGLWKNDNDFWIVLLSNHYLWGWDPMGIARKFNDAKPFTHQEIHAMIRSALVIEDYTSSNF